MFYVFKYSHSIVLLCLFYNGRKDIDRFDNLGYILFLVIYTSYTWIYRQTSKMLTVFTAFFIFGNYYFSLRYRDFVQDVPQMAKFKWLGFFECDAYTGKDIKDFDATPPRTTWQEQKAKCYKSNPGMNDEGADFYFAHIPNMFSVFILIVMAGLNTINHLFKEEKDAQELERKVYENIRKRYPLTVFAGMRISNFNKIWLPKAMLIIMIVFLR